jgi:transcriptional regulator with XRE-family HTH domain
VSTISEKALTTSLGDRIAGQIRRLRGDRGMSLDALAAVSGVSRSMISLIERGRSSPTAVVLERLAAGLGVPLASLFDHPEPGGSPVARSADQPSWRDPLSGYLRRNVSPAGYPSPIQIVEVTFPAGARVAYETGPREVRVRQQVWLLHGVLQVWAGDEAYALAAGDCLALELDRPVSFHNPGDQPAHYAVVLVSDLVVSPERRGAA